MFPWMGFWRALEGMFRYSLSQYNLTFLYPRFFVTFAVAQGYESMLYTEGDSLKKYLAKVNEMHERLQASIPTTMKLPTFWCEDDDDTMGIRLHYHSERGSFFASMVRGMVLEIATQQFDMDVDMNLLQVQEMDEAKHTT